MVVVLSACGAQAPDTLGPSDGSLAPCPGTPNCVHTGLRDPEGTEPIFLRGDVEVDEMMSRIASIVAAMPRTRIVSERDGYLHAEATSMIFRFVDDLELLLAGDGELVVRSASRVGRSDLGVNARRVERLRAELARAGLTR